MNDVVKFFRVLADSTRIRLLGLLQQQELSVQELQEITKLGQSRISTHLAHMQKMGLVQCRREGKRSFYCYKEPEDGDVKKIINVAIRAGINSSELESDLLNLKRVIELRQNKALLYFNQVSGRFGRSYGPGRSWQAFAQMLIRLIPKMVIADLGSGEGLVSELLAMNAKKVIAVDNSKKIVEFGISRARKNGIKNLEFRLGDLEDPPISDGSVDLVLLSQALHHARDPERAIASAWRILQKGGRIVILDLLRHTYEQARVLHGDLWPGFGECDLQKWLSNVGFKHIEVTVVAKEESPPYFQTILAYGEKP